MSKLKYSSDQWEEIRMGFLDSIMFDTPLSALAENLGKEWPLMGKDETPKKYLDKSLDELKMMPEFGGDPAQLNLLLDILSETMEFDDPFGDMVESAAAQPDQADELMRTLKRIEIPENYPISLTNLAEETRDFCNREKILNVGEFVRFFQSMAQNIVVGGDYRSFLNALADRDEVTIAKYLPTRPGEKGLYLAEAVGLLVDGLDPAMRLELYSRYGGKLDLEEESGRPKVSSSDVEKAEAHLMERFNALADWFQDQRQELSAHIAQGQSLERFLMTLHDPKREVIAAEILLRALGGSKKRPGKKKKAGFFARLFGKK